MSTQNRKKKGFTLIEMLVVIAIIAILVAVIVPVIGKSTSKAAAATNAANLRAVEGQIATMLVDHFEEFQQLIAAGNTVNGLGADILNGLFGANTSAFLNERYATYTADSNGVLTLGNTGLTIEGLPTSKAVSTGGFNITEGMPISVYITKYNIAAYYGKLTVEDFADIADNGQFESGDHVCTDKTSEDGSLRGDGICDICGSRMGTVGVTPGDHAHGDSRYLHSGFDSIAGFVMDIVGTIIFRQDGLCDECGTPVYHAYSEMSVAGYKFCRTCGNEAGHACHKN